jgi:LuxR family transcriptional regulator, maltose regulon positive regulatory protein
MAIAKVIPFQKEVFAPPGDLIAAKLSAPILRSMLVRRSRLTDLLWEGMQRRLTLIVAPAGYGKTTLLSEWLSTITGSNRPVAWVTLDPYDSDPLHFWSYIVAALRTIQPSLQFNVQVILHGLCEQNDCTQLTPLINEISGIPHQFNLILDDYHEIRDQAIHRGLTYFIGHMPENCHLILASRVSPPLQLSRLRARGQLVEISAKDLSFTFEETGTFLSLVKDLDVSADEIASLAEITEGWITGLQLVAISLQGRQDAQEFINTLVGSQRNIFDYLVEEVLNRQEETTKNFLLKTSILTELSAPLCDAILGHKHSWKMLSYLEKSNLFIFPLDEHRFWYRYHALFSDMLRIQLERSEPGLAPRLHLAACHWLKENGYPEKAVMHASAAGEAELAAELVEAYALQAIIRMDLATVLQWFKLLPQAQINKRHRLAIYNALVNLMLGKVQDLEGQLSSIEMSLADLRDDEISMEEVARLRRYVNALRAAAVCMRGDFSLGIRSSQGVLENLLPEDYFFLGLVEHYMGYAYQAAGRLSEGIESLEGACQNALNHNFHKEFVLSQSEKARFYRLQGRLNDAAQAYRLAVDYANAHVVGEDIRIAPLAGLAEILSEWNQVPEADKQLSEPVRYLMHSSGKKLDWFYTIDVCLIIARNCILHSAYEEAGQFIQMAQALVQKFHFIPEPYAEVSAVQVQLWLARGDVNSAASWLNRKELQMHERLRKMPSQTVYSAEQISMARVYLALGQPEKAGLILNSLLAIIENGEQGEYILEALIVKALAQWHTGQREVAADTLLMALALAEPENRLRSFIDEGVPMQALLLHMRKNSRPGKLEQVEKFNPFIEQLLIQAEGVPGQENVLLVKIPREGQEVISPQIETLSQRESQVLDLLSRGYSAGDIARDLVISVNTSKAHIKNIYQKLDVHNRREAIEKAMSLHLLAD